MMPLLHRCMLALLPPGAMLAACCTPAQSPAPAAGIRAGTAHVTFASAPLRPGDVIRLKIWREPDLSGDFTVDERGIATLPKIGPVTVTGTPIEELRMHLLDAYREYLNQASIEVTPLRRIQVTGAVHTPGLYTTDATMTVADALALAGGATPQAKVDHVRVVRDGVQITGALSQNTPLGASPLRSGDQIYVPERSWVSRNPGLLLGILSATVSLAWALRRY